MLRRAVLLAALTAACGGSPAAPASDGAVDASLDGPRPDDAATDGAPTSDLADDTSLADAPTPDTGTAPDAGTAPDTGTAPDATTPDVPVEDVPTLPLCSRPLLPISGTRVTSQRPTLQFARAPGLTTTLVEVCRTRDCASPVLSQTTTDDYLALPSSLAPGVYFWRLTPRNAAGMTCRTATWSFTVPARSATLPRSWGAGLDVNGDGYGDVAVGTVDAAVNNGEVRVFLGGPTGLTTTAAFTAGSLPVRNGSFTAGPVVAAVGDLNGDGYGDLAVGLPAANNGDGEVRVYFGSPTGTTARGVAELQSTDGHFGRYGASVAGVGDVEGDGYGDLAVGAPFAQARAAGDTAVAGRVYLHHGLPQGVLFNPTTTLTGPRGPGGRFGASVAGAGDVNADRFPDLAVGAPGAGTAHVYRGTALGLAAAPIATFEDSTVAGFGSTVASAGDADGDNHADLAVGGTDARVTVRLAGAAGTFTPTPLALTLAGPLAGVGAADTNGDGFTDLVLGESSGRSVRRAAGSMATPLASLVDPVDLTAVTGLGPALAPAGDVDRDGYSDLVIAGRSGAVVVAYGAAAGAPVARTTLSPGATVTSVAGAWGGL